MNRSNFSLNVWICKVGMEIYLKIKNGVFLVQSVKCTYH